MPAIILVLDPDKRVLASTKNLLIKANYKPFCASNLELGLTLINRINFDLILCDTQLPHSGGYELLRWLTKNPQIGHIPFLFLASKVGKKEIQTATSLGADGYIFKPIELEKLIEAIERRLSKQNHAEAKIFNQHPLPNYDDAGKQHKRLSERDYLFRLVNSQPAFVKVANIKYITAHNNFSRVFVSDGRSYRIRKTLSEIEKKLPEEIFVRIHRSTIINIDFVDKIEKWFNNTFRIYLKEIDTPFEMSRRYSSIVKYRL